jgi:hypothetical protein
MHTKYHCAVGYVTVNDNGKKILHLMEDPTAKTRTAAKAMLKSMAEEAKTKGPVCMMVASEEHMSDSSADEDDPLGAFSFGKIVRKYEYMLMKPTKGKPGEGVVQKKPTWKKTRVPKPKPMNAKQIFIELFASTGRGETTMLLD